MDIRIDPSELQSNSLLPKLPNSFSSPGLEALTGCDFAIAQFPLPIEENTLTAHIKAGTMFVQRKSGYDFIGNFEQAHREIARIQACGIPIDQAFLLAIGYYYPDDNGFLRIKGKRPLKNNKTITYDTFLALEAEYRFSSVHVVKLNDESEIELWINAQIRELETIQKRNNRKELYPPKTSRLVEYSTDLFQEIVEIPEDNIRSILARGFPGLGQVKIDSIVEYATKHHYDKWGIYFFKIMTDEDIKGKAVHKVKGIGTGLRRKWRESLGLPPGYNLIVENLEAAKSKAYTYNQGWQMALSVFRNKLENGTSGKVAFKETWEHRWEFYE